MDVILDHLKEQEKFAYGVLSKVVELNPLSEEEQKIHTEATNCKLCGNCFDHDKVRHHDHVTGCYIEPCCNKCNLKKDKTRKSGPYDCGT